MTESADAIAVALVPRRGAVLLVLPLAGRAEPGLHHLQVREEGLPGLRRLPAALRRSATVAGDDVFDGSSSGICVVIASVSY